MNLPEINVGPTHSLFLSVLKKKITFIPFTIQQEKGILSSMTGEAKTDDIIENYLNIAKSCILEELDWEKISLIDFMHISILLRAKSQGETISLEKKECMECKKSFPFDVNIEDAIVFENKDNIKKIVEVDENLKIEIVPLKIDYLKDLDDLKNQTDVWISLISRSISKIFFKDQIYTDLTAEDIKENCVNNLTKYQVKLILMEIENLISMKMVFDVECPHCRSSECVKITNFLEL